MEDLRWTSVCVGGSISPTLSFCSLQMNDAQYLTQNIQPALYSSAHSTQTNNSNIYFSDTCARSQPAITKAIVTFSPPETTVWSLPPSFSLILSFTLPLSRSPWWLWSANQRGSIYCIMRKIKIKIEKTLAVLMCFPPTLPMSESQACMMEMRAFTKHVRKMMVLPSVIQRYN